MKQMIFISVFCVSLTAQALPQVLAMDNPHRVSVASVQGFLDVKPMCQPVALDVFVNNDMVSVLKNQFGWPSADFLEEGPSGEEDPLRLCFD